MVAPVPGSELSGATETFQWKANVSGITEWWLTTHYVEETVELVAQALSYLSDKGVVHKEKRVGREILYKLKPKLFEEKELCQRTLLY